MDEAQIRESITQMLTVRRRDLAECETLRRWLTGQAGTPEVPKGSESEIKHLAVVAKRNVIGMVVDTFAQNLGVVGYRAADEAADATGWDLWQRARMDARQDEVHRPALVYGLSYLVLRPLVADGPVEWLPRSPRQLVALYEHDDVSPFPVCAMEVWVQTVGGVKRLRGALMDDEWVYPLDLGTVADLARTKTASLSHVATAAVIDDEAAFPHRATYDGTPVCPVVRFVNGGDADSGPIGEVAPLIASQRALNEVNFDRHIVSRFGAFPQKVISGWAAGESEVLKASARRVWTFEQADVKATALPAASVEPYNAVLREIVEHIAQVAQISPAQITGQMANLSAEALWAAETAQQRKLDAKRRAFGESWELALHLAVETTSGQDTVPHGAEVIWRSTEARSFGAIIDGITKLSSQGVPIDLLMPLVPGMTQQQVKAIRDRLDVDYTPDAIAALAATPLLAGSGQE
ncbi:phage portal protein [Actinomyces succiniciruminis]|uniref:Phage portal protein, SPP1 Gp6-like n=1 Tax=Actinomyces succiniciruminis TaxID=1522002 RepID=A0A1L7RNC8_9ACTO|nr:phage portal protein [Actinomyces succiniciruminis]CED90613.1 Phage portal protein, SPP1 Gp6-like [Actinomyces succiniciruminis]